MHPFLIKFNLMDLSQKLETALAFVQQNMATSTVIDELGKTKADVRNPFIAAALEILNHTENRYSGIPTIYSEMKKAGLLEPKFENLRGTFKVTLFNKKETGNDLQSRIIDFCKKPRSKDILAKEFGFDEKHPAYFINNYVIPLIEAGKLRYTIPDKPKIKKL